MGCMEFFAKRIKELREKEGLSQRALAVKLGISDNGISQYETCKRTPDIDVLILFADYFNTTCDYLVGLTDDFTRK